MLQKIFRGVMSVALLSLATVGSAQEPATVLLKSGERVSGELYDMTGSEFIVTVNGQQRRFPISDAAVIDFSGDASNLPPAEVQKVNAGQNLLVLKDGQQIVGKFYDVGGTHPLRITFTANGQQTDYQSSQVARIYMAAPSGTVATSGSQSAAGAAGANAIHVSANRAWTPTGITVQQGQVITFSSSGQVQLSADPNDSSPVTGRPEHRISARGSLPTVPGGALIGRIGNGKPFGIGDQTTITAPATGPLYLGINDDVFTDNQGEFVVNVTGGTVGGAIRRR